MQIGYKEWSGIRNQLKVMFKQNINLAINSTVLYLYVSIYISTFFCLHML